MTKTRTKRSYDGSTPRQDAIPSPVAKSSGGKRGKTRRKMNDDPRGILDITKLPSYEIIHNAKE